MRPAMTPHSIVLVLAVTLLAAAAILIIAGLHRRPSRHDFALARAVAMAVPTPVMQGARPNPARPRRSRRRDRRAAPTSPTVSVWPHRADQ